MITATLRSARPDRVIATSVVAPYPVAEGPVALAQKVLSRFLSAVGGGNGGLSGSLGADMQPEEIASKAAKLSAAMRQGFKPPRGVDRRLLHAAQMISSGHSFTIRSAGRAAMVSSRGSSAWPSIQVVDEGGYNI